ncbi:nicotinate phosphoribosyltransferase [Alkaliphilus sp. B6464]|uniref:nicotinate phosphoribosyltransferase n=1 Tax=Alkaliphilus sp. B6464 TaxID=2731219 RepID=UPI001BAE07E2|nr:nicotinate phosphoribosyltransferase [Alkaliphilus sp. B6464]QUH21934.1 nicotinate phosphoribosyltransferase [Alkaliphilus sp. B6464]
MTKFNNQRIAKEVFQIDPRIKSGWFSDEYLNNTAKILTVLAQEGYKFGDNKSDLIDVNTKKVENGNIIVEMQFFTRRKPLSIIVGVDEALAILEEETGYYDEKGNFVNTYHELDVEAVHDGNIVRYNGDPLNVQPMLKIRGRYRDFAHLETVLLGVLSEPTRIATNVFNTLVAANGKDVLFFPARFAHYKMQGIHGYAHKIAIEVYNEMYGQKLPAFVSTHEQGSWWGGKGGGTVSHATIASFLGNTPETMMQFARVMPVEIPRTALIDFHNDCIGETLAIMEKMFNKYWELYQAKEYDEAEKYKLYGVRPDTSGNMIDKCIDEPYSDDDFGVNPKLIWRLRKAINNAYKDWTSQFNCTDLMSNKKEIAKQWCEDIKIAVTGGFSVEKIERFEKLQVPVDIYGVGSSLLSNDKKTNNDFTADVVRIQINGEWHKLSKVGRRPCDNSELVKIQ